MTSERSYDHRGVSRTRRHAFMHAVAWVVGAHSHDAADQVDLELEVDAAGRRTIVVSLVALALTAAMQSVVVYASGSVALLGDTLHNVADALTAIPLLVAFALARRAPSRRYTYGYGRAEDLAGLCVILVIAVSCALTAFEALSRLLHPQRVTDLWAVALAAVVGFAGNELVARYRIVVGRRIGSAALVADGLHARADGITSLGVLVAAGGVALGWEWADPIMGLLITVAILGILWATIRQVGARLMDGIDPSVADQAYHAMTHVEGIREVRDLRLRWIGHTLRAEADIEVDPELTLRQAHQLAHRAERSLVAHVHRLAAANVHVSPSGVHAQA